MAPESPKQQRAVKTRFMTPKEKAPLVIIF